MKHRLEYALLAGIGGLMRLLPRRARLACGRAVGSLVFAVDRRHRKVTIGHVDAAFRDQKTDREKRAIAEGAFRHFGAMLFELISLRNDEAAELVELEGVEHFEKAKARGKGVILLTGHFGNWEIHGIAHGARLGQIHVLARVQENPYLNAWLEKLRSGSGNVVVYKKNALSHIRHLLRDGETVALVIDQNVHLQDAVFVDFFGRQAATTPVPAWFALRMDAALLPAFCLPTADGKYRAVYREPIDCAPYREMDRDEAVRMITQELARVQENVILENPDCWLWMHKRWNTRPPEESASLSSAAAVPELR